MRRMVKKEQRRRESGRERERERVRKRQGSVSQVSATAERNLSLWPICGTSF